MQEFLATDVRMMIDNEDYPSAFDLTNYIFVAIGKIDIDDSGGEIGMLSDDCFKIWLELYDLADLELKRSMFQWFIEHLDGSIIDYMEDMLETMIMEYFIEVEFIQDKLDIIDLRVKRAIEMGESWSRGYEVGKWAVRRLHLMEEMQKNWNEIDSYCKEYWEYSAVREYYVDQCIQSKDYSRAIDVLNESLVLDQSYLGLVKNHRTKLKEIYRLIGNREEYIDQLWNLMLKDNAGDLDIFKELKDQYTNDEWIIQRERIFAKLPKYGRVDLLYKEEKLYDRLLKYVQESTGLYTLQQYEDLLSKLYPVEILEKYRVELEEMARRASNRKNYQYMVTLLSKMSQMSYGKQMVKEIADGWKTAYSNRRAMMEELNRLKI